MSSDDYKIREPQVQERPELVNFLMQHFYTTEYLLDEFLTSMKETIDDKERNEFEEFFKERFEIMLEYSPSLIAVDKKTGEIAGVCIFWLQRNPRINITHKDPYGTGVKDKLLAIPKRSKNMKKWFDYVLSVVEDYDSLFKEYPHVKYAIEMESLSVHPNHSRKGLATRLMNEAVQWAERKEEVGMITGIFTSPYSKRAAEKNDFKIYKNFDVSKLTDDDENFMYPGIESYIISFMVRLC